MIDGELIAGLIRDSSGLIGAALLAAPFFYVERRKREAEKVRNAKISDADLAKNFETAIRNLHEAVITPFEIDTKLTKSGLGLIGISFIISFFLTLYEHSHNEQRPDDTTTRSSIQAGSSH